MNVFDLFASLKLDDGEYKQGIENAKQEGEKFANHTEKKVSPKAVAGWMAIVAVIVKVIASITKLAKASMDYADTVGDLASKYGVSTDAISEMQYIADQSSTSIEGLTSAMSMLYNKAKEDGDAFKEVGISVKDANGNFKTMDELFYETVGVLNDMESEGQKSAYMLEFFGRSAMNVGEVLRKNTDEINAMRQEAHDLGVVMQEETINFASDFNDKIAVLKLQMNSAIASMVAGTPDAEEKFDAFFENLLNTVETYLPAFAKFIIRFAHSVGTQLLSYAPTLIAEFISVVIDAIFDTDWFAVGVDVAKAILQGVLNVFGKIFSKIFGYEFTPVDLGVGGDYYGNNATQGDYSVSQTNKQEITVKVEATGDTPVSEENAEKTAQALAPYIDKILGGY